jgi:hypothetical protein
MLSNQIEVGLPMELDSRSDVSAWSDQVYFVPLIGPDYERGLRDGVRVLLLGDSHYRNEGDTGIGWERDCTVVNFQEYLDEKYDGWRTERAFFKKLPAIVALKADPTPAESASAWRSVAFANAVQSFMDGARRSPTKAQYAQAGIAVREMVDLLQPDVVLVLGSRLWKNLPADLGKYSEETALSAEREDRDVWLIPTQKGHARVSWIFHPSTHRESVESAIGVLAQLIDLAKPNPPIPG